MLLGWVGLSLGLLSVAPTPLRLPHSAATVARSTTVTALALRRRRLSGRFVKEEDAREEEASQPQVAKVDEEDDQSRSIDVEPDWSDRSLKLQKYWDDPEWKARVLARRRETLDKKKGERLPKPPKVLTPALQARSDAKRLQHDDERAWMAKRLAEGAPLRERIYSDDAKRRAQLERSEKMKRSWARRRRRAGGSDDAEADTNT